MWRAWWQLCVHVANRQRWKQEDFPKCRIGSILYCRFTSKSRIIIGSHSRSTCLHENDSKAKTLGGEEVETQICLRFLFRNKCFKDRRNFFFELWLTKNGFTTYTPRAENLGSTLRTNPNVMLCIFRKYSYRFLY